MYDPLCKVLVKPSEPYESLAVITHRTRVLAVIRTFLLLELGYLTMTEDNLLSGILT